jgi:hypothetical protein
MVKVGDGRSEHATVQLVRWLSTIPLSLSFQQLPFSPQFEIYREVPLGDNFGGVIVSILKAPSGDQP